MNCDSVVKNLPIFLYGELSFEEEERFHQHLESCANCRAALESQSKIHQALDGAEPPLPVALLANCRRDLRLSLREQQSGARTHSWKRMLGAFSGLMSAAWMKPAAAVALVLLGFFAGKLTNSGAPLERNGSGPVMARVRNIQPDESGRVHLVVEETRERRMAGHMDEEPIRQLLLAAATDPSDPALRFESMDILRTNTQSEEVRQALVKAVQQDPSSGVRLKALEGLKPYAAHPEVRRVLSRVLLDDDNATVRTQAVDLLIQQHEPEMVGVLQELMRREQNNYIRYRSQQALRQMNASVGTF